MAGCQSYEPWPLHLDQHRRAWHARTLEVASLTEFLEHTGPSQAPTAAGFDLEDGLSLEEARVVALAYRPELRSARLRVGLAAAEREEAGLAKDPTLEWSAQRAIEDVPDPWVFAPALVFSIPLGGKLSAERGLFDAHLASANAHLLETEWTIAFEVRRAWFEWSAEDLRASEIEGMQRTLDTLVERTRQLAESGQMLRTEAALFAVEAARVRSRRVRTEGSLAASAQQLLAQLGLPPAAQVEFAPQLGWSAALDLAQQPDFYARHPKLKRLVADYEATEQDLRHEIALQYPDLSLGPQFESDQGLDFLGLVGGLPIPVWNKNRKAIARAYAKRLLARAEVEVAYEQLAGSHAVAKQRSMGLTRELEVLSTELAPLLDRQVEDALDLMALGEGSALVLLTSLTQAHQTKLDVLDLRLAQALAQAETEYLSGPPEILASQGDEQEQP